MSRLISKADKPALRLTDDQMCFGCGPHNRRGLRLRFSVDSRRKTISTVWRPTKEFQGYAGIVHGGMIGMVLDETMGNLLWVRHRPAVTAELTVRFLKAAPIGAALSCEASITSEIGRVIRMEATAKKNRTVIAKAKAVFVHL